VSQDAEAAYGDPVLFIETFTDPARHAGTCYKAANFVLVGKTSGYGRKNGSWVRHDVAKLAWVYPLQKRARAILAAPFDHPMLQGALTRRNVTDLNTLERRGQYRGEASLRTWLHRILYHLAVDGFRHGSHEVSVAEVEDLWSDDSYSVDPSIALERAQSAEFVRDALVHLRQGYRSVVVLHDGEGWPSSEIAQMLDISRPATKQQ